jgi:colanic acid biosynthesis protein WcaH
MTLIPDEAYKAILAAIPILCVDIVVKDQEGRFLLVKRARHPLKGKWWVPGGRVLKGETISQAASRKILEELGVEAEISESLGYYEGHFRENEMGVPSGVHTVSIVVLANLLSDNIQLDYQSTAWKFAPTLPKDFKIVAHQSIGIKQ